MNKLFIVLFFLSISVSNSFSQGLTEKYTSFDLRLSTGTLNPETGILNLAFAENSIREINYELNKNFDSSESFIAFEIGLKFGKYHGLSYSLELIGSLSGQGKGKFGGSVGYNYPIEVGIMDLLLRPSLGITTGSASLNISEIEVDTFGIVIEDTDYVDRKVGIDISQSACYLVPKLEAVLLLAQRVGFTLAVGYDYEIGNNKQNIEFTATDFDATSVDFTNPSIDLTYNGTRPTDNIFKSNGVTIALGLSWYYNRE